MPENIADRIVQIRALSAYTMRGRVGEKPYAEKIPVAGVKNLPPRSKGKTSVGKKPNDLSSQTVGNNAPLYKSISK